MSTDRLRVAIVGCGSMGTHHARVIAADPDVALTFVDAVPARAEALAARFGGCASPEVPVGTDAAVVATPSTTHAAVAAPLLARGVWCLVEKPLAHTAAAARALDHPRCAVGHIERFNPAIRAAGPLAPRRIEAQRAAPPTGRGLDVDVVLDLMIHDLELVLGWAADDASVAWIDVDRVPEGDTFDEASVRFSTTCGLEVSLRASRVAPAPRRVMACFEAGRTTVLDFGRGRATRDGAELPVPDRGGGPPGPERDALGCQWEAFVRAVRTGVPFPPAARARAARAVALAEQIARGARREA